MGIWSIPRRPAGSANRALELIEMACRALLEDGLARECVAGVIDLAQLKCRPSNLREDNLAVARRWIERCLGQRDDLSEEHRAGLEKILAAFGSTPEEVFDRLGELRRSFVAPVPGLLGERIGPVPHEPEDGDTISAPVFVP